MNAGKTMFAQLMEFIPWTSFARIVERYSGNFGVRRLSCAEQFRVMAFAQHDLARKPARYRGHHRSALQEPLAIRVHAGAQ
jgi:hypothetical protein